jgi:hypothetical protein
MFTVMCDIFIMYFALFLFVACFGWNFKLLLPLRRRRRRRRQRRRRMVAAAAAEDDEEEEVSLL